MKTKNFDIRSKARISKFFDENKTFQYSHYCQFRLVCEKVERKIVFQMRLTNVSQIGRQQHQLFGISK